ncbi:MAG: pseudouridine synthase [Patescibacteria group bacterium]
MRINKYLASLGIASRRKIDEMVEEGRVKVNNKVASVGQLIDPQKDQLTVDDKKVQNRGEPKVYIVLNKPTGYTSTAAKIKGEKNVLELVSSKVRLYPVGRLDRDSTGLILLTNDGELALKLTHPKFHIPKTYEVKVLGGVSATQLEMMRKGIKLEDGITKPADVKIKSQSLPRHSILEITLYEGKKRQIRRMTAALHLHVVELKRISIGPIKMGSLSLGKFRNLSQEEFEEIKKV